MGELMGVGGGGLDYCNKHIYSYRNYQHPGMHFLALCSPIYLLKRNIYALFGRLKQYFACFDCSIFLCAILLSSGIQAETGVTASTLVIRSGQ